MAQIKVNKSGHFGFLLHNFGGGIDKQRKAGTAGNIGPVLTSDGITGDDKEATGGRQEGKDSDESGGGGKGSEAEGIGQGMNGVPGSTGKTDAASQEGEKSLRLTPEEEAAWRQMAQLMQGGEEVK